MIIKTMIFLGILILSATAFAQDGPCVEFTLNVNNNTDQTFIAPTAASSPGIWTTTTQQIKPKSTNTFAGNAPVWTSDFNGSISLYDQSNNNCQINVSYPSGANGSLAVSGGSCKYNVVVSNLTSTQGCACGPDPSNCSTGVGSATVTIN